MITTLRLDDDLVTWTDEFAASKRTTRTGIIRTLLEALRRGEISIEPNPFPGDSKVVHPPPEEWTQEDGNWVLTLPKNSSSILIHFSEKETK